MCAQAPEDFVQERVLEFLCDDISGHSCPPGDRRAQPFEISVVENREDAAIRRRDVAAEALQVFALGVTPKVFRRESRHPKKIEHGPGKLPVTFARDLVALLRRQSFAEGGLEI